MTLRICGVLKLVAADTFGNPYPVVMACTREDGHPGAHYTPTGTSHFCWNPTVPSEKTMAELEIAVQRMEQSGIAFKGLVKDIQTRYSP